MDSWLIYVEIGEYWYFIFNTFNIIFYNKYKPRELKETLKEL